MKRMSAWPIETYSVLCVAFYDGHKECYMGRKGNESFNPESWGFQQAWAMHKMISALRTKAMRDEIPRELSLELANRMFCFDVSLVQQNSCRMFEYMRASLHRGRGISGAGELAA